MKSNIGDSNLPVLLLRYSNFRPCLGGAAGIHIRCLFALSLDSEGLQGAIGRYTLRLVKILMVVEDVKFATWNSLVVEILNCEAPGIPQLTW